MLDPLNSFGKIANIQEDFNLFHEIAEVMKGLADCHFEKSVFEILASCNKMEGGCNVATISNKASENLFILVGKMTQLSETIKGYPSKDLDTFKDQNHELGADLGLVLRLLSDFHPQ